MEGVYPIPSQGCWAFRRRPPRWSWEPGQGLGRRRVWGSRCGLLGIPYWPLSEGACLHWWVSRGSLALFHLMFASPWALPFLGSYLFDAWDSSGLTLSCILPFMRPYLSDVWNTLGFTSRGVFPLPNLISLLLGIPYKHVALIKGGLLALVSSSWLCGVLC
jgi:hypothetical protein